jgi:PKD repeat protein
LEVRTVAGGRTTAKAGVVVVLAVFASVGAGVCSAAAAPANKPPVASFTVSPSSPVAGQTVTFRSTSTDPEGGPLTQSWDLDGDGAYDDAFGPTASRAYSAGDHTVGLRVQDRARLISTATRVITVRRPNRAPVASFVFSPRAPVAGQEVDFTSTAQDPDGPIATQSWDLNGDGLFGDESGPTASRVFSAPGAYTVGLRVTDAQGASDVVQRSVNVAAAGAAPPPPPTGATPSAGATEAFIVPFPVVRLAGRLTRRGVRVTLLAVRAPKDSVVTVRCGGRSCRTHRQTKVAGWLGRVRFPRFEHRLRAGVRLVVTVTKPDLVGKYTRFRIRRGRQPARVDACLVPRHWRPQPCG